MLKENIKRREELMKKIRKENEGDPVKLQFRGEVEIKAWKNKELFYHDGGSNTVTIWAKHALVRLLSGDSFSSLGTETVGGVVRHSQPSPTGAGSDHTTTYNADGTLLSGYQYFWDYQEYLDYFVNRTSAGLNTTTLEPQMPDGATGRMYPFFPTKMLFGTGFEFEDWADFIAAGYTSGDQGYVVGNFPTNIDHEENYFSGIENLSSKVLLPARTVNDLVTTQLTDVEAEYEDHYTIDGPIKDCLARTWVSNSTILEPDGLTNMMTTSGDLIIPKTEYNGVGRPAFIYCKRSDHWFTVDTSEVAVKTDEGTLDNRITFTVVLPEQAEENEGLFYPYNGHQPNGVGDGMLLKQAGLFCDARLTIKDEIPGIGDAPIYPYSFMPGGIMLAKRKISPITKSPAVRISVSWSLYL